MPRLAESRPTRHGRGPERPRKANPTLQDPQDKDEVLLDQEKTN